jgi:hypothetical protein
LFHDFGGAIRADFACRIVNPALRQRKLAATRAFFRIEFLQSRGALLW